MFSSISSGGVIGLGLSLPRRECLGHLHGRPLSSLRRSNFFLGGGKKGFPKQHFLSVIDRQYMSTETHWLSECVQAVWIKSEITSVRTLGYEQGKSRSFVAEAFTAEESV